MFRAGQWHIAAAGVTNVTTGVDVTPETVMHIGSITKVLNASLVMQLGESPPVKLRPIRDGRFISPQEFVTFLNPGTDGRMQHLVSRRCLHKRTA